MQKLRAVIVKPKLRSQKINKPRAPRPNPETSTIVIKSQSKVHHACMHWSILKKLYAHSLPFQSRAPLMSLLYAPLQHPALAGSTSSPRMVETFSQLPLRSDVVGALGGMGVSRPTVIQMLAVPKIARGKNVLVASETGSYGDASSHSCVCRLRVSWS